MFLETVTPGWRVQDSERRTGMMGALKNVKLTGQNAITHGKGRRTPETTPSTHRFKQKQ